MYSLLAFISVMAIYSTDMSIQKFCNMNKYNFKKLYDVCFEIEKNIIDEAVSDIKSKEHQSKYQYIKYAIAFLEKQKTMKYSSRRLQQSDISDDIVQPHKNNNEIKLMLPQQHITSKKIVVRNHKSYNQHIVKHPNQR